jgi:lysophospholipase L1-like esterase
MSKTILCYGDSNTWGFNPATFGRFPAGVRWTGVLRRALGADYVVVEEGLSGRTTVWDDPVSEYRNGKTYLIPCLDSHHPIDLVTIMLGTNDLKTRFGLRPPDIAEAAGLLAEMALHSGMGPDGGAPRVLLLAPPVVVELTEFAGIFEGALEKSRELGRYYGLVAKWKGCDFLDTAPLIVSSPIDGIHLEADQHEKLGQAVAAEARRLLGEPAGRTA